MPVTSIFAILKAVIVPSPNCHCGACAQFRRSGAPRNVDFFNLNSPAAGLSNEEEYARELQRLNRGDCFDAVLALVAALAIIIGICIWSL